MPMTRSAHPRWYTSFLLTAIMLNASAICAEVQSLRMISVNSAGAAASGPSLSPSLDSSGANAIFESGASDLVTDDTNGRNDIFLANLLDSSLRRVSLDSAGQQSSKDALHPALISGDGSLLAFMGYPDAFKPAGELGASCYYRSIYVKELISGTLRSLPLTADPEQAPDEVVCPLALSTDGRYMAFLSSATNIKSAPGEGTSLYLYDLSTDSFALAGRASGDMTYNCDGFAADISADGRFLVYEAKPAGLGAACIEEEKSLMLFDRETAQSREFARGYSPSISADGRRAAFVSRRAQPSVPDSPSGNNPQIYVYNRETEAIECASLDQAGAPAAGDLKFPSLSATGRYLAFLSSAANLVATQPEKSAFAPSSAWRVLVRDLSNGSITVASRDFAGNEITVKPLKPALSDNGAVAAFVGEPVLQPQSARQIHGSASYQVYAARLDNDLDALPLSSESVKEASGALSRMVRKSPPVVRLLKRRVAVSMQGFSRINVSLRSRQRAVRQLRLLTTYELMISDSKSGRIRRMLSSRPRLALRLKPAQFKFKYRLLLRRPGQSGVLFKTALSPAAAIEAR